MPDSSRNLVLTLTLVLSGNGGTTRVPIPTDSYFRDAQISLISDGVSHGTISLFEADQDESNFIPLLETLFFAVGLNHRIEMRWKWDDGKPIDEAPLYEFAIVSVRPDFQPDGTRYTIDVAPSGSLAPSIISAGVSQLSSFKAGTKVTDIITQIASLYGWPQSVMFDGKSKSSIEAAAIVLQEDRQTINQSHVNFIRYQLLPLMNSSSGRHYVFFFDASGAIHFHSDTYLSRSVQTYEFRDLNGEVIAFSISNEAVWAQLYGGNNAIFVAPDSENGNFYSQSAKTASGFDPSQVNAWGGAKYTAQVSDGNTRKAVIVRSREELRQRAMAGYSRIASAVYQGSLEVLGTHALYTSAFVTLKRHRSNGTLHYVSGDYYISSVQHNIAGGRWSVLADITRMGNLQPPPEVQRDAKVIQKVGQALNISATDQLASIGFSKTAKELPG